MSELLNCQNCELAPCVPCVENRFLETPEFSLLDTNPPRFSLFMWEDEARFREWMGDDANPVEHGRHQAEKVAVPLIEAQRGRVFTDREAKLLVLTNVVHDYHEGLTGDIPAPDKTEDIDRLELSINQELINKFLDPDLTKEIGEVMGDFKGETFVGRAFQAVELLGYMRTAARGWYLRNHPKLTPEEQGKCFAMGVTVAHNSLHKLLAFREEFTYVDQWVNTHSEYIKEVM